MQNVVEIDKKVKEIKKKPLTLAGVYAWRYLYVLDGPHVGKLLLRPWGPNVYSMVDGSVVWNWEQGGGYAPHVRILPPGSEVSITFDPFVPDRMPGPCKLSEMPPGFCRGLEDNLLSHHKGHMIFVPGDGSAFDLDSHTWWSGPTATYVGQPEDIEVEPLERGSLVICRCPWKGP